MNQPVARTQEVNEGPKINNFNYFASVNNTNFRFCDDALDPIDGRLASIPINGSNLYGAVVLYIDFSTRNLTNFSDNLATGPYYFPDFIFWNASWEIRIICCTSFVFSIFLEKLIIL